MGKRVRGDGRGRGGRGALSRGPTLAAWLSAVGSEGARAALLAVDELHYGQNLAALLRIADAGGVGGVVLPPARSHPGLTPAVRDLAGAAAVRVPLIRQGLFASLAQLRRAGYLIVGACEDAPKAFHEVDYTVAPVAFVLGGEDKGLSSALRAKCEELVSLPMRGQVPSLNVAATAAVLVYERLRQWG